MTSDGSEPTDGKPRFPKALRLLVGVVILVIGIAAGFLARQPSVSSVNSSLAQRDRDAAALQEKLTRLQSDSDSLSARLAASSQKADDLQKQLAATSDQAAKLEAARAEVADLQARLETARKQAGQGSQAGAESIRSIAAALESDRLLLIEMRKDTPDSRQEAQRYWTSVRALALQSSPDLRPQTDKIMNALPVYFNWAERNFTSSEERGLTYVLTGAAAYESSINDLWKAVLLKTIDHIDALARLTSS